MIQITHESTSSALLNVELIPITIGSVTNTLDGFGDGENQYTVKENTNCVASGKLNIPAQKFRVPFLRVDNNRAVSMVATVDDDGNFSIELNFPTRGDWIVNTELLNSKLPQPMFSIAEQTFSVVKKHYIWR